MKSIHHSITMLLLLAGMLCNAQTPPTCSTTLPYTESFNTTPVTTCWSQAQVTGTASSSAAITSEATGSNPTTSPYEGTRMLKFNSYSLNNGVQTRIMSSAFSTANINGTDVEFYWYHSTTGGTTYNDRVQVQYSLNGTTWVNAGSEITRYASTSAWVKKTVSLPAAAANQSQVYVAFLFTSGGGYNCYLDNVTIKKAATCFAPATVSVQNITAASATLSWSVPTAVPSAGYEYYYSTSAIAPTTTTTASGSTAAGVTLVNISSLSANTLYNVWVRANCGSGDKSEWSTVAMFTTPCTAIGVPYTQNFDSATTIPQCSVVQDVNADTKTWAVYNSSSNAASGSNSLRYTYSSSNAANDWWFTPGIATTTGTTYRITFAYRGHSADYAEGIELKAGTAQNAAGMATTLFTNTNVINTTYTTATVDFTASTTGVTYFGWHATSAANKYYVYLDDVSVTLLPGCENATFPASVTAVASKTSTCTSEAITFSLGTTMPAATGITYRWKSSADGITYTSATTASALPAATITANANAQWFKCEVLCNGNVALTSAPVQIGINVSVLSTTAVERCGTGKVPLSAQTASGNTVKWYDAATNGNLLGTGSPFTSPQISHTTTFYAAATGTLNNYTGGPANPQAVSTNTSTYRSNNNGYAMQFTLSTAITLKTITVYPLDNKANNIVYLKDSSNNTLKQLTFSTIGVTPLSTTSSMGSPYIINLNWEIPAGSGYKIELGIPSYQGENMLLHNGSGASSLYNVNNNGLTFTGNTGLGNNYWYYFYDWKFSTGCGESDIRVPLTATVNYEWNGSADTNWNNASNWCGGTVPNSLDTVTINNNSNQPVINGQALAKSLTVNENAHLTINTGATLTVTDAVTVHPLGNLTIQDNGALVQVNNVANTGNITQYKKSNLLYRLDYTLWSSPVTGAQTLKEFSPYTTASRFYGYDYINNSAAELFYHVDAATTTWQPATGILVRMPGTDQTDGYDNGQTPITFTGTFTGTPNNGTITKSLNTQGGRFTATGNPYASPINVAAFFAANSTVLDNGSGIWLWRKRNNSEASSYATLTLSAFVANPAAGGGSDQAGFYNTELTNSTDWLLTQGQGFFVKAAAGLQNPVLTFTNAMRRTMAGTSQAFFRTAAESPKSRLWLNMFDSNGSASQTAIVYQPDATLGIDYSKDGKAFTDANMVSFYSVAENTILAIQARPDFEATDVVQMGYYAPAAGAFTISLANTDGLFSEGQKVYIRDNYEGITRNLNQADYTFTSEAGTFNERFEVVYQTTILNTENPVAGTSDIIVYKQGDITNISSGNLLMQNLKIFDIRGRELYSQNNINTVTVSIPNQNIEKQVVILQVTTEKGTVSKRIIY